jgi:hypothetical protein
MKAPFLAAFAVIGIGCIGCPPMRVAESLPEGFVPVEPGAYLWRAMSAEGVVLGLRSFVRDPEGEAAFWTKVVRRELESGRGYAFESEEAIAGGRALLFAGPDASYWIALFLTARGLWTFEAGGPRADLAAHLPAIRMYLANLKLS